MGDYIGTTIGVIKGDTRSLDCSLCGSIVEEHLRHFELETTLSSGGEEELGLQLV